MLLPGAGRFALASSRTKTQSLESDGVKSCVPLFENIPRLIVAPVCGLNHQPWTVLVALVIFARSTVIVVALPFGMYAMIVCPSDERAVVVTESPDPYPAVTTAWLVSGTINQCSRLRNNFPRMVWY